jgi:hypothetical protein
MPLSLEDQATLATEPAFRSRVEAAIARYAAYQAKLPAGHEYKVAALAEWAPQAASEVSVRQHWIDRTIWYGISKAIDDNLADLAAARAAAFDAGLTNAIETAILAAHS